MWNSEVNEQEQYVLLKLDFFFHIVKHPAKQIDILIHVNQRLHKTVGHLVLKWLFCYPVVKFAVCIMQRSCDVHGQCYTRFILPHQSYVVS